MRKFEEIYKDAVRFNVLPDGYNALESHCFLCMQQLLKMHKEGYISSENAAKTKTKIASSYEKEAGNFEFKLDMFNEHIENIKKTESDRTKLRKLLNDRIKGITSEDLAETIAVCLNIINDVFPDEFK